MSEKKRRMQAALVGIGVLLFCTVTVGSALELELYHDFGFEDISTGVTVCSEDRVFVSFPRWFKAGRAANPSVAVLDGKGQMQAFPRSGSFAQPWEEGVPRENHFVNIQSIFCDHKDRLFVLDTGTPFLGASEGAKLILFSPDGELQRVFPFDKDVAPETSYLNDVRVTREGNHAILTDSNLGGLVVLDLENGESWKVLADHPSTHAEDIVAKVEGQEVRLGTGDPAKFQSDGLAVLGDYLFYCAMTSRTLYRIPVKRLVDRESSDNVLSALVERVSSTNMPDGIVAASDEELSRGVIFMTGVEGSSIDYIDAVKGTRENLISDERLQWPDCVSVPLIRSGKPTYLYVTVSQVHLLPFMKNDIERTRGYGLYRVLLPSKITSSISSASSLAEKGGGEKDEI